MIEYKNIILQYDNQYLFNDFSLRVQENEKVLISGRSGIGKSSLFRLALGFARPESGSILYRGREVNAKNIWRIRQEIAYLSQDVIIGKGKVGDVIADYFNLKALSHLRANSQKIDRYLAQFKLDRNILEKSMGELSGGEKQRIAIIIALLLERKVFLLDEATSSLDKELKQNVAEYFGQQKDVTLLCISHDAQWQEQKNMKIYNLETQQWER